MSSETKTCQNCKERFTIQPEDFAFYKKVQVSPPTFCPECRLIRKMVWRNLRNLYRRKDDSPGHEGETLISFFNDSSPVNVYEQQYWRSDEWDPLTYGRDYDFSRPFFTQFIDLFRAVPHMNMTNLNSVNTEFANATIDSKECYLLFSSVSNEQSLFSEGLRQTKQCVDCLHVQSSELCYECVDCDRCTKVIFGKDSQNCIDCAFIFDCRNCHDCIGCWNLRNEKFCIFNQRYSEESYRQKVSELRFGSFSELSKLTREFNNSRLKGIVRYARIVASENVTGDNIVHSKNCQTCFGIHNMDDSRRVISVYEGGSSNHDILIGVRPELCYDGLGVGSGYHNLFNVLTTENGETHYVYLCFNSSYLFGCVGLRNKRYCILNKQYTKEEYETLVPKVIAHMNEMPFVDKQGRVYKYGEFFPTEFSPFAYNETIAQEYFPLTKEEALAGGYRWREPKKRSYEVTIHPGDLPECISDVTDDILKETVGCAHEGRCTEQCTTAFKIVPQELEFYRQMNLPLPRLCPNCRHYQRLKQRNPLKLWHRQCMCDYKTYKNSIKHQHNLEGRCQNEFETPYAPERKETVYCKQCYNSEIV